MYTSFAWTRGLLPNIDFINGYPGLLAYLLKSLYVYIGSELYFIRIFSIIFSLVTASCLFYITFKSLNTYIAALVFLSSFFVNYLSSPLPNPGNAMSACISLAMVLVLIFINRMDESAAGGVGVGPAYYLMLLAAAFFTGLAISFKQAGLFGILGLLMFLVISLRKTKSTNILQWIAFFLFVVIPFSIFIVTRVPDNIRDQPYNFVVLIPWAMAIIIGFKIFAADLYKNNLQLSLKITICISLFLFSGSVIWLFLYPVSLGSFLNIVKQIYIIVPAFIDKLNYNASIDRFFATLILLVIIIILLFLSKKQISRFRKLLLAVSAVILVSMYVFLFKITLLRISPVLYESYLIPSFLSVIGSYLIIKRRDLFSYGEIVIILAGFIFIASGFPYPKNTRYASFGVLACYLPGLIFLHREYRIFKRTRAAVAVFCVLLFVSVAGMIAISYFPVKYGSDYFSFHNSRITISKDQIALLKAADWLKENTSVNDTIGGYPNFALVFYLIEKTSYDRFPNFIGNENDYNSIAAGLNKGNGPDYYLLSPVLYPYTGKLQRQFIDPHGIEAALARHYRVIKVIQDVKGNDAIYIHRRINI